MTDFEYLIVEKKGKNGEVGLITLNRPKAMNALSTALMTELLKVINEFEKDDNVGAVVLTGSQKAFSVGGDLKEAMDKTFSECIQTNFLSSRAAVADCRKPMIAAVNGLALGAGCQIAMMCDIIYAGESARFGFPEIIVGTIPACGGTQRLTRAVGKSRAMEMVLSGNPISAQEADHWGLVSRVFPSDKVVDEAIKLAETISANSQLIVSLCKEAVNQSFETTLQQGLFTEKRLFHATFATKDRLEGMAAFVEKRPPKFEKK